MKKVLIPSIVGDLKFFMNSENGKWILTNNPREYESQIDGFYKWKPLKGTELVLFNTGRKCNLDCIYCCVGDKKKDDKLMSFSIARKALQRVSEMKECKKRVVFHGSEPLINFPLIKEFVKYGKELDSDIEYSLQTNGTLLTDEKINFIVENGVQIGVSLDGLKRHQNKTRPFKNKKGSYDIVVRNLSKLRNVQEKISLISVVTRYNVSDLDKIVQLGKDVGANYMSFHSVVSNDDSIIPNQKDLTKNLISITEKYFEDIIKGNKTPVLDNPKRYLYMLMNSQNSSNSCAQCSAGPSNPLLAIDYDGTIYPCDHFWEDSRFSIGNIEEMTLDEASKSLKNFRNNKEFGELENCVTCDWKRVCGGGCPGEGMLTNQDNIAKLQEDF